MIPETPRETDPEANWRVTLRLPNGRTRRIGASSHASRDTAIASAIRHVWNPRKSRKSLAEYTVDTSVVECVRNNGRLT